MVDDYLLYYFLFEIFHNFKVYNYFFYEVRLLGGNKILHS